MNRKQNTDPQDRYRMNYYPTAIPAGYAVAATDKPGLYATSPYAGMTSAYATAAGQPGLPPGMQHYAAAAQQYAMVSQPSPYSQHAAAAYYASPSATGYATTVPLSSLQTIPTSTPQTAYLGTYPTAVGVQRAMLGPTSATAAGYGGSPLYAASTYTTGLPGVPGQPSRPQYGVAPVGYATATNLPPSVTSPAYPGATGYGPPY